MDSFFLWLESTPMSVTIRESQSVFMYPAILSAHAIGMGLAGGICAALALHVLAIGAAAPAREFKRFIPVMWFGFIMNAVSGVLLLIAYPTKALTNPLFYLKLSLIGLGLWTSVIINHRAFQGSAPANDHVSPQVRFLAITTLVCWTGAIVSGRLLAYTYTRLLADF
jgi:hypothetical protein